MECIKQLEEENRELKEVLRGILGLIDNMKILEADSEENGRILAFFVLAEKLVRKSDLGNWKQEVEVTGLN